MCVFVRTVGLGMCVCHMGIFLLEHMRYISTRVCAPQVLKCSV